MNRGVSEPKGLCDGEEHLLECAVGAYPVGINTTRTVHLFTRSGARTIEEYKRWQTEGTPKIATPHLRVQGQCTLPLHDGNVLLDWSLWLSQVSWGLQYPKILSLLFRLQHSHCFVGLDRPSKHTVVSSVHRFQSSKKFAVAIS